MGGPEGGHMVLLLSYSILYENISKNSLDMRWHQKMVFQILAMKISHKHLSK